MFILISWLVSSHIQPDARRTTHQTEKAKVYEKTAPAHNRRLPHRLDLSLSNLSRFILSTLPSHFRSCSARHASIASLPEVSSKLHPRRPYNSS